VISPYQNRRFDSDFLALKEVIESGKIGDVVEVESHFDYFRPDSTLHKGSKRDGAFYGLGVHTIDQIIYLFGNPEKVYYDIRSIRNKENPDDYYEVQLYYKDFKVMVKTSHLVKSSYPKIIVHGSKGSFIKYGIDKQEECLKAGIMPKGNKSFGLDTKDNYGVLDYVDEDGKEIKEIVKTPLGDYGRVYEIYIMQP
jgi:predicted dehydrogenase